MQSFVNECFARQTQSSSGGGVNQAPSSNYYKNLDQIQVEGHVKIRKIFTMRAQIPLDEDESGIGGDFIDTAATVVEAIPKNMAFN